MKFPLLLQLICCFQIVNSQNLLEYEVFEISPNIDTVLVTKFGAKISISQNSFKYVDDSTIVENTIILKVKEIVDKQDMILEGITTSSNEGILVSSGMILLEAYSNQSVLELKENETLGIEIPSNSGLTDMSVYEMNDSSTIWRKNRIQLNIDTCPTYKQHILTRDKTVSKELYKKWQKENAESDKESDPLFWGKTITIGGTPNKAYSIPVPIDTIWTCDDFYFSRYSFNITSLGWYNIDKLRYESNPINLIISTDEDLDIFLLLENENICIRASKTKDDKYLFGRIPGNKNARIIGYRYNGFNNLNLIIQDIYLLKGEVKLKPSREVTAGEFKRIIKLNN